MKRVKTYVDPDDVYGDDLNEHQDATMELRFGDTTPNNEPAGYTPPATLAARRVGVEAILVHHKLGNAAGEVVLDASADFRDRYLWGVVAGMNNATKQPIGANYVGAWDYAEVRQFIYTGTGCVSGAPPTPVVGAAIGTYITTGWGAGVWIYARSTDGALCAHNNIAADVWIAGVLFSSGDIGGF